ncbi:hypothetical protein MIMGU_mgv1a020256mg [Erythranthe guttata]|uniref:RING-type E3 ubiquitin transferase n=1 Tax=Erythranthe guttata TaxID=4155 RepID=A0A022RIV0_ERYGU|nr:hypothetical protein MIMGU_mgv1a020256mg [Erythranthe guttata]
MGGCCCSSRKAQFHGTPMYYYVRKSTSLLHRTTDLLECSFDLGLNMSLPDTYQSPPASIPYNVVLGPGVVDCVESTITVGILGKSSCVDVKDQRNHLGFKIELELLESKLFSVSAIKDEEYDEENPKITTRCNHHFHLSCILEWMERSDTCPICDQVLLR